ncbi:MAG TPA: amino acid adenylation domain-containing protein [Ktedonobacteraceae bacterium]|nr:amino acid adenylation domain-containing protein [Ktedonobacteraceae bacterium]
MQTIGLKGADLSPLQERVWGWAQRSHIYHAQCAVRIKGVLHPATFQQALQEMVEAHEILHTVFDTLSGMELPVQIIEQCSSVSCPLIDLENIATLQQEGVLAQAFDRLSQEPCDPAQGPLLRTFLYLLTPETYLWLFKLPALCADAATLQQFVAELFQRYESLADRRAALAEPLQYIDVSAWQKDLLATESARTPYEFWNRVDLSRVPQMRLPLSRAEAHAQGRMKQEGFAPEFIAVQLDGILSERLQERERCYNVSRAAFLLACWYVLLWRLTGEAEQVVGVAGNGRVYEELADAIGPYTCFIPMSIQVMQTQAFEQVLTMVSQALEQAMQWQNYFSWPLAQHTAENGDAGFFPLAFECEYWPEEFCCGPLTASLSRRFHCIEPFALKLSALCVGDLLQLELHYDTGCFSNEQVRRLASMLCTLLHEAVERPGAPIRTLHMVEPCEQARLLRMFQTPHQPLAAQGFHQLFEEHARLTPNRLALQGLDEQLTYQQVNERANQLAHVLRRRGVTPNTLVALHLTRSAQMIVCILAVFKAGGAYVPLEPDSPLERLAYQLRDAQPSFLLTQQALCSQLPAWDGEVLSLESLWLEAAQEDSGNLPLLCHPGDLAYVIYTSGSTGVPKGVMICQRSILNYTQALCKLLRVEPGWQFATVSTLAADLGNTVIFCALASGGTLHILDYATITSVETFAQRLTHHPIDVLKIVPSHLSALLAGKPLKEMLPRRALVLGGEALPVSLVKQIQKLQAGCAVYNHYGPTETTIGVLVNELKTGQSFGADCGDGSAFRSVPLGKPIAGTDVYVLDPWMRIVPEGVVGELYVGGNGLANGYLHQPEQTAERFVPHPWSEKEGARLYRTGDLVRYEQGQIEFLGRKDNQVKLRGYRIEIGEIETLLKRHPQVRDGVVLLQENRPGEAHLEGYIVARKQPVPSGEELRTFLRAYLPEYMLPSTFKALKAFPLTANGKLDRQQLATSTYDGEQISPVLSSEGGARKFLQPRDKIEFQLLRIWEELLQMRSISIGDNFFDLGGHSILAVRLMSQIFQQFGQDLALTTLFQRPTIADLAVALREKIADEDQPVLVAIQPQGTKPPFFCIHPAGGSVFCYVNLARYLGPDQPFYGLQAANVSSTGNNAASLEDLAAHYVTVIQAVQPQGPYLLGGWSMGGVVALEIAQQLHRQGHTIALLAVIDSMLVDPQTRTEEIEIKVDYTDEEIVREEIRGYHIPVPADFDQLGIEEQKKQVLEKAKEMHLIPPDLVFEQIRPIFRKTKMHQRFAHSYVAQPYPCRIDYFQSSATPGGEQAAADPEATTPLTPAPDHLRLWRQIAQGRIEMHPLPGDHTTMLEEPNVQMLALSLKQCIGRVCDEIFSATS